MYSLYPGAALVLFLTSLADQWGKLPYQVYEEYRKNPRQFNLIASYRVWKAAKDKAAAEEANRPKGSARARTLGR